MSQLFLPFESNSSDDIFSKEAFLTLAENHKAVLSLNQFFAQKDFSQSTVPVLILKGPKSCGKTHILHFLGHQVGADFLNKDNIISVNPVNFFHENGFYILDDIETIKDEELILRLFNSAHESGAFLVISATKPIKFKLKDLASRMQNVLSVSIEEPDLESIKHLLINLFARKQIKLSKSVIDFISKHIPRSYEAILAAVKLVEFHAQEEGKALKMPRIKAIFTAIS